MRRRIRITSGSYGDVFVHLPGCTTGIISDGFKGEKCKLFHLRHGKVIGETEGHYNSYGSVLGDELFANNDPEKPNGHLGIIRSKFHLPDSGVKSGVEAWHAVCWQMTDPEKKRSRRPSESDPDQGWGEVRREYCE